MKHFLIIFLLFLTGIVQVYAADGGWAGDKDGARAFYEGRTADWMAYLLHSEVMGPALQPACAPKVHEEEVHDTGSFRPSIAVSEVIFSDEEIGLMQWFCTIIQKQLKINMIHWIDALQESFVHKYKNQSLKELQDEAAEYEESFCAQYKKTLVLDALEKGRRSIARPGGIVCCDKKSRIFNLEYANFLLRKIQCTETASELTKDVQQAQKSMHSLKTIAVCDARFIQTEYANGHVLELTSMKGCLQRVALFFAMAFIFERVQKLKSCA